MTVPIFIITKDRLTVLKKSIDSYLKLGDVDIILIDNGSTYPPMVQFLGTCPYKVISNTNASGGFGDISEFVGEIIREYSRTHAYEYYVVTDPDIELEHPSPLLLAYYIEVLANYPMLTCVGPMLRIDDLPECFHFRDQMIHSHMEQFWDPVKHEKNRKEFKGVTIQLAPIDTTFAMYRRTFNFRRLNMGARVHEPFMARHLDWYFDTLNPDAEQRYYIEHASNVSTMSVHVKKGGMG